MKIDFVVLLLILVIAVIVLGVLCTFYANPFAVYKQKKKTIIVRLYSYILIICFILSFSLMSCLLIVITVAEPNTSIILESNTYDVVEITEYKVDFVKSIPANLHNSVEQMIEPTKVEDKNKTIFKSVELSHCNIVESSEISLIENRVQDIIIYGDINIVLNKEEYILNVTPEIYDELKYINGVYYSKGDLN